MESYEYGKPPYRGPASPPRPLPWDSAPASTSPAVERKAPFGIAALVAVALASALLGGVLGVGATLFLLDGGARTEAPTDNTTAAGGGATLTGVAAVAEKVIPSVVQIDTAVRSRFGTRQGTGSGVVYSADGYIITNKHVIQSGGSPQVTLSSGERLPATVVGVAEGDIAVLKVERTGLQPASFGSASKIRVGDVAVAVGSPYGLEGTVTAGVISAVNREIPVARATTLSELLQTDAPINPGNSGGALVNADGEVIGINTAIVEGAGSLGFAMSIDAVLRDVRAIIGPTP